jgi:hypothetical protein
MHQESAVPELLGCDTADSGDAFIPTRGVSRLIGVEESTLAKWRRHGIGPPWYSLHGHLIRYDRTEVLTWVRSQGGGPIQAASTETPITSLDDGSAL